MKELLLNSIVSKAREFATFSMNTGSDFDPWNLKSADFCSFIHSTLEITLSKRKQECDRVYSSNAFVNMT